MNNITKLGRRIQSHSNWALSDVKSGHPNLWTEMEINEAGQEEWRSRCTFEVEGHVRESDALEDIALAISHFTRSLRKDSLEDIVREVLADNANLCLDDESERALLCSEIVRALEKKNG